MPIKALALSILSFEATWFDLNEATGIMCTREEKLFLKLLITQWRPNTETEAHVSLLRHMSCYDVTTNNAIGSLKRRSATSVIKEFQQRTNIICSVYRAMLYYACILHEIRSLLNRENK